MIVTEVGGYRGVPAEEFAALFEKMGCESVEAVSNVMEAFPRALAAKGLDGMLFCAGSLYLVGEIKDIIRRMKK